MFHDPQTRVHPNNNIPKIIVFNTSTVTKEQERENLTN